MRRRPTCSAKRVSDEARPETDLIRHPRVHTAKLARRQQKSRRALARLEDLTRGAQIKGVRNDGPVEVVDTKWFGTSALELTFKDAQGRPGNELLYRTDEPRLEVHSKGPTWNFDADGSLFRLVSEAYRIRLAYLFDPLLAVHTSLVEPLPHQILVRYRDILPPQPLSVLLSGDPGAGNTIMAGPSVKKLFARGERKRSTKQDGDPAAIVSLRLVIRPSAGSGSQRYAPLRGAHAVPKAAS